MDKIHPSYYAPVAAGVVADPLDFIRACRFSIGSALKYLWRAGKKPGESEADDLGKADFYLKDALDHGEVIPDFVARGMRDKLEILCSKNEFWEILLLEEEPSQVRLALVRIEVNKRLAQLKKEAGRG